MPVKGIKSFTVMAAFGVGSRNEKKRVQGISHFLEHMIFKGTKKRPSVMHIASELDSIGAVYNAFTGKEITAYYVKADAAHFEKAVDVLSDVLKNSTFPQKEIEKERAVIKEEAKMWQDDPKRRLWDLYGEAAFNGDPLARNTIGTTASINRISKNDLKAYITGHYQPENRTVVVAGSFSENKAKQILESKFGRGGEKPEASKIKEKKPENGPHLVVEKKPLKQIHLMMGFLTAGHSEENKEAVELLDIILGSTMSSRLNTEIREKRGLAYAIGTYNESYETMGSLLLYAGLDGKRIEEAIPAIWREFKKLKTSPVSKKELERAKQIYKGRNHLSFENTDAIASWYAEASRYSEKPRTLEQKIRLIDKITSEDLQKTAKTLFTRKGLSVAVVGPTGEKKIENLMGGLR